MNNRYCWFVGDNGSAAAQGCLALSISLVSSGLRDSFFLLLGPQKYRVIKILFRLEREKQAQASMTNPTEEEGCSAGGVKRGKSSVSMSFFTHFHFEGPPVARHSALPFTGSRPAKCSSRLASDSSGCQSY